MRMGDDIEAEEGHLNLSRILLPRHSMRALKELGEKRGSKESVRK